MSNMITEIFDTSDAIQNSRSLNDIFTYLVEEVGELATEVNIVTGYSKKEPGKDGLIGEAVDAIICLVDLIGRYDPDITEEDLLEICQAKLAKWKEKT